MASKARAMQQASEAPPQQEALIPVTIVDDKAFEYHFSLTESVLRGILDPDTPDAFIEVPCALPSVKHAYLHTSRIAKFYQHAEFSEGKTNEQ